MNVKILFDKESKNKKLRVGWGVSFLINETVLFDTGEDGAWLLDNIRLLDVDISKIKTVVISHEHWDHIGGLWELLGEKKGIKVYICPGFSDEFKAKVKKSGGAPVEAKTLTEVDKDIFVTGEIEGKYKGCYMPEQALILKTARGISVITGCAHPGIIKMIKKAKSLFPQEDIYSALGGFHLLDENGETIKNIAGEFRKLGVKKAGPTHCSGEETKRIFREEYGKDFIDIDVGGSKSCF
ncbi:MAG: MBL fold metallo-hydrolase [Candidatus Aureabacteria bacterium]|nr:MBL fold metallo-hydrolase [Candidatus Auribacterota bacterium]